MVNPFGCANPNIARDVKVVTQRYAKIIKVKKKSGALGTRIAIVPSTGGAESGPIREDLITFGGRWSRAEVSQAESFICRNIDGVVHHINVVVKGGVVGIVDSGGDPATDCSKHSESGGV